MVQKYIIYSETTPFLGYILQWGVVDTDQPPDGSTVYEYIQRVLAGNSDYRFFLYPVAGPLMTETIREQKKIDPVSETLVDQLVTDITPKKQAILDAEAKAQSMADNLPSWVQVKAAVNNISNLAEAKAFLLKLSRVVYWLAKNQSQ